ncbi:hypothetical protein [Qipengyuania aquimaris]|uniref:Uncharacterized protein n=1 Tax=Qipengyuania aquimaris TaxID=255984 RepID=A0A9Q3XDL4_9SPHN|nr:hypothetical protein [Qipengyuania aquimaris]MBY6219187.1 hypothetical protein [Qipengyuania aquimaris]
MAKKRSILSRWWFWLLVVIAALLAAGWASRGEEVRKTSEAGTAYAARVACSCRYVAGRSLEDCGKDKVAGLELVMLSENETSRSVTASIPFVASDTATYREGYGCVLKQWDR